MYVEICVYFLLLYKHLADPYSITSNGVQYILDSVLTELLKNQSRFFSYAETGFFWRWYSEQTEGTQKLVKNLVDLG